MTKRIVVPAEAVRTREAILEGQVIVAGHVWTRCWNCGGSGNYPSSCTPPGLCRLYCWADMSDPDLPVRMAMGGQPPFKSHDDPTFGKRPTPIEKFVKSAQAEDRREYRRRVQWELDRPAREAEEVRQAAERAEREAREAAAKEAARVARQAELDKLAHVGAVGDRLDMHVVYESYRKIPGSGGYGWQAQSRYLFRFRDEAGNVLVLWTSTPPCNVNLTGQTFHLRGTVKEHSTYNGERQTVIQRVKLEQGAHAAA